MSLFLRTGWAFLKRDFLASDPRAVGLGWLKAAVFAAFWFLVAHWIHSTPWITVSGLRIDYYTYSLAGWVIGRSVMAQLQESSQEFLRIRSTGQYLFWNASPVPLFWLFLFSNGWRILVTVGGAAATLATGALLFRADLTGAQIFKITAVTGVALVPVTFLGMLLASGEVRWRKLGELIRSVLNPFLMLTNGVFLPVSHFPLWVQAAAWCSPLTHALVFARGLAFGNGMIPGGVPGWAGLGAVALALGLLSAGAVAWTFRR